MRGLKSVVHGPSQHFAIQTVFQHFCKIRSSLHGLDLPTGSHPLELRSCCAFRQCQGATLSPVNLPPPSTHIYKANLTPGGQRVYLHKLFAVAGCG